MREKLPKQKGTCMNSIAIFYSFIAAGFFLWQSVITIGDEKLFKNVEFWLAAGMAWMMAWMCLGFSVTSHDTMMKAMAMSLVGAIPPFAAKIVKLARKD